LEDFSHWIAMDRWLDDLIWGKVGPDAIPFVLQSVKYESGKLDYS